MNNLVLLVSFACNWGVKKSLKRTEWHVWSGDAQRTIARLQGIVSALMQNSPTALQIERAAKIGRDGGPLYEPCDNCGAYPEEGLLRCKGCMSARYCNRHC